MDTIKKVSIISDEVNKKRKDNKNKWYYYSKSFEHQGKIMDISIKGFGLWLQLLTINGIEHSRSCECEKVADFKILIEEAIEYHM